LDGLAPPLPFRAAISLLAPLLVSLFPPSVFVGFCVLWFLLIDCVCAPFSFLRPPIFRSCKRPSVSFSHDLRAREAGGRARWFGRAGLEEAGASGVRQPAGGGRERAPTKGRLLGIDVPVPNHELELSATRLASRTQHNRPVADPNRDVASSPRLSRFQSIDRTFVRDLSVPCDCTPSLGSPRGPTSARIQSDQRGHDRIRLHPV